MKKNTIIKDRSVRKSLTVILMLEILSLLLTFTNYPTVSMAAGEDLTYPYTQIFTISAYYSPLEGQEHYVTGTYEGDIRLNGNGTNGADGTPVYPGMVAAPSIYEFGTKMYIPGIGIVAVHDRGGAIVSGDEEFGTYDRLDIWMGYGDTGLERALNWGMRDVEVTIYGIDDTLEEEIYLEGYSDAEKFVKTIVITPELFSEDLWYGDNNDDIKRLQEYLAILDYYNSKITGYYDDATMEAVFNFQVDNGILDDWNDLGAGHFGINTRFAMDKAMEGVDIESELTEVNLLNEGLALMQTYPDLYEEINYFTDYMERGDSGADVYALQTELNNLGYFMLEPTGYYGEMTEHAVFKLQQRWELVETMDDPGAGVLGPNTRSMLNEIIGSRVDTKSYMALKREEDNTQYMVQSTQ